MQTIPPARTVCGFSASEWFCNLCNVLQGFAKTAPLPARKENCNAMKFICFIYFPSLIKRGAAVQRNSAIKMAALTGQGLQGW
ncbi:hypothetical protein HV319_18450 [Citrobacter freundii]|uniref:hypothetical protein n=1 Tax=Citrobacter freundii TaxID=546 RepID=UPI0015EA92D8|nr:hypothetical protein [Citrobacter freundii]QLS41091.1 hypothetical protein HV319_18450 [Citrobacter freundii]